MNRHHLSAGNCLRWGHQAVGGGSSKSFQRPDPPTGKLQNTTFSLPVQGFFTPRWENNQVFCCGSLVVVDHDLHSGKAQVAECALTSPPSLVFGVAGLGNPYLAVRCPAVRAVHVTPDLPTSTPSLHPWLVPRQGQEEPQEPRQVLRPWEALQP